MINRKCKIALIMSALLILGGIAFSQDQQNEGPIIALEYQGEPGVWMPTETFRIIVQVLEESDNYKQGYFEMSKEAERLDKLHEGEFERRLQAEANAETQKTYRNYALIGGGALSIGAFLTGLILGGR